MKYQKNKKNIIKNGQKIILKKYLINQTKDVIKKKTKVEELLKNNGQK